MFIFFKCIVVKKRFTSFLGASLVVKRFDPGPYHWIISFIQKAH